MRWLPCTLAAIATIAGLGGRASGDGAGVIAVGADRAGLAAAMADAIAGRARRVVPDAVAEARGTLAAGAVPVDRLARFRRVRDQIDEGWRAYQRVAVDFAAQRLASARTDAVELIALPGGAELYADASLKLGAVLGHLGRKAESTAALRLALALDPDRPITLAEFSPDVVELVDAARAVTPAVQRLEVKTEPAGAAVWLDGKDVGRAPLVLDVPSGQHLVVARLPQHTPAVQGISLDAAPGTIALALEPDAAAARLSGGAALGLPGRAQQELVDLALAYADLDEVIVVVETARRGAPTLLVQRCAGQPARCSAVVDIGFEASGRGAAARAAWEAVRLGELRYPPGVLGERADGRLAGGGCRVCRSPWLWGGVGAALVTAAVVTLVVTSGDRPAPIVGVDPGDFIRR